LAHWHIRTSAHWHIRTLAHPHIGFGMIFPAIQKTIVMKSSRSGNNMQSKQMAGHRPKPEVRDDLDSRSGEEQDRKGDDVTHNRKDVQNERSKKK
jgi:UPF0716 family protein affecting phage T7 exclusion